MSWLVPLKSKEDKLKSFSKVSIKKLDENKQETKQWSSYFENKIETLITDIEKVLGWVTDTTSK